MEGCVQMLLDIAHERDEDIPALIYEARGVRPAALNGRRAMVLHSRI